MRKFRMNGREVVVTETFHYKPVRLDVDPRFDVMRILLPGEVPPSIASCLASKRHVIVYPTSGEEDREAYASFISNLFSGSRAEKVFVDDTRKNIPDLVSGKTTLWILGWMNKLSHMAERMAKLSGGSIERDYFSFLGGKPWKKSGFTVALALPLEGKKDGRIMFIALRPREAWKPLSRKIPHYGKYGFVVFKGPGAMAAQKGKWKSVSSPLKIRLAEGISVTSSVPKRKPFWRIPEINFLPPAMK